MARPRSPLAARPTRAVLAEARALPLRPAGSSVIDALAEFVDAPSAAPAGTPALPPGRAPSAPAGGILTDLNAARAAADSAASYAAAANASANRAAHAAHAVPGNASAEQAFDRANAAASSARAAATRARTEADAAQQSATSGDDNATRDHATNAAYQVGEARRAAQDAEGAAQAAEALAPAATRTPLATLLPGATHAPDAANAALTRLLERMGLDAGDVTFRAMVAALPPEERDALAAGDGEPGDTPDRVRLAFARAVYGNPTPAHAAALAWLENACVSTGPLRAGRLGNIDAAWCALPERLAWRRSDAGRMWKLDALYSAVPESRPAPGAPNPAAALSTDDIEFILLSPASARSSVYATKIASACRPPVAPESGALSQAEIDAWNAAHPACSPIPSATPVSTGAPGASETPAITSSSPPAPRVSWWQWTLIALAGAGAVKVGVDHYKGKKRDSGGAE